MISDNVSWDDKKETGTSNVSGVSTVTFIITVHFWVKSILGLLGII